MLGCGIPYTLIRPEYTLNAPLKYYRHCFQIAFAVSVLETGTVRISYVFFHFKTRFFVRCTSSFYIWYGIPFPLLSFEAGILIRRTCVHLLWLWSLLFRIILKVGFDDWGRHSHSSEVTEIVRFKATLVNISNWSSCYTPQYTSFRRKYKPTSFI